ncbi:MAG TPA: 50S ribosomal protein L21 [Candidatus Paceibacterota bacterium]
MSFAVIKTGGKQYQVKKGDVLRIEKLADEKGQPLETAGKVVFDEVLLVDDGKTTTLGTPTISGIKVTATVMGDGRHKKVMVVRYLQKSRYYKKNGHRQPFTEVKIESIG